VHNVESAIEYAQNLQVYAEQSKDELFIVMRVYFEKPRTTVGWKGLINDPDMNSSFQINKGLRIARALLIDLAKLGLPVGCEFLDTISPQYTADLVSWGAIGARTTESQVHRELTSALSMPTGFKNSTDGSVGVAVDACRAARTPHVFLSVGKEGLSSIIETDGNPDVHVILRGGSKGRLYGSLQLCMVDRTPGPNYAAEYVKDCGDRLKKADLPQKIMVSHRRFVKVPVPFDSLGFQIDCSHGNSQKNHKKQLDVVNDIVSRPSLPSGIHYLHRRIGHPTLFA
jgi:3-deoxy-7-phosphoheptulonate synthase